MANLVIQSMGPSYSSTRTYPTLPYPTLPYPTLPYPTLPYPTLPYPTLPYPTLPYPTQTGPQPFFNPGWRLTNCATFVILKYNHLDHVHNIKGNELSFCLKCCHLKEK